MKSEEISPNKHDEVIVYRKFFNGAIHTTITLHYYSETSPGEASGSHWFITGLTA